MRALKAFNMKVRGDDRNRLYGFGVKLHVDIRREKDASDSNAFKCILFSGKRRQGEEVWILGLVHDSEEGSWGSSFVPPGGCGNSKRPR